MRCFHPGKLFVPGGAPGVADKGGIEVDHDDSAGTGDDAQHVVGQIARGAGESAG